jgi:hypothetical protein
VRKQFGYGGPGETDTQRKAIFGGPNETEFQRQTRLSYGNPSTKLSLMDQTLQKSKEMFAVQSILVFLALVDQKCLNSKRKSNWEVRR